MRIAISITLIAALAVTFLYSDLSADGYSPRISKEYGKGDFTDFAEKVGLSIGEFIEGMAMINAVTTLGVATALTVHNVHGLRSDNPNKYVGIFGTVWGGVTVAYGGALIFSAEDKWKPIGVCATALGITSIYYGVKSLARVRGKYLESKERGLSIDPVIIGRGRGKADVGIQISLRF